jgi:filamentous hemagglutinin family protein
MYLAISPILGRWGVRLGLAGAIAMGAIAFGGTSLAQVVPDATLGSVVTDTGSVQTITGGTTRETNLFHSFDRFSIPTNGTALFDNATNIQNILTRVTGGSISDIDGLIQARGAANLFLLNPNGIVFGQNARLNIGGSFVATTARSINFADGSQFSAIPAESTPLLTVSVPLGLQFGTNPREIINRSLAVDSNNFFVGLQVQPGKSIGLIGGNVRLEEGGELTAAGGRIELGAVAAPGVVGLSTDSNGFRFSFPTDLVLGDISLLNESVVDVRASGGGSIAVNARNLSLTAGSQLSAGISENQGAASAVAGDIEINALGTISIDGQNQQGSSGFFNNVDTDGTGKGGNINIKTGSLFLTNDGVLAATTFGAGDAGNVNITAADGVSLDNSTVFSRVRENATGKGGNVTITARSLSLTNGAALTTSSLGTGNAGNIDVQAQDSVSLDNSLLTSNLGSRQGTSLATGNVGNISIKAKTIALTNGAELQAGFYPNARQQGSPGLVSLEAADSISVTNSEIFTDVESDAVANGSNIQISAPIVSFNDAFLNASSTGQGNAGNIEVQVQDSVSLNNSRFTSNLGSEGETTPATGNVGNIQIKAKTISLTNGARVEAGFFPNARQQGSPGLVSLEATESVSFAGRNSNNRRSAIFTDVESDAVANGSNIQISAPIVSFNDAFLNASSAGLGSAGSVAITASDRVSLDNSTIRSRVDSTGDGNGGDITITARSLSLTNGAELTTSSLGTGNAGNIDVQVQDSVSLDNSLLTSNLGSRQGTSLAIGNVGNISIKAKTIALTNGAELQAGFYPNARQQGSPGLVSLEATESISFAGRSSSDLDDGSAIFTDVESDAVANGSNIQILTPLLSLTDAARLEASNSGLGNGGNIELRVSKSVRLRNGSQILTSAGGTGQSGNAGNITINSPLVIAQFQETSCKRVRKVRQVDQKP